MELTGAEKAVLLLLSMDEAAAAPIIAELEPNEVRQLREAAARMRAVPSTALDEVYTEFVELTRDEIAVPRGGVHYLQRVATRALGEEASAAIFEDGPQTSLQRLVNADPGALAAVLENEHPQLVAAVLSQLSTDKAASVLNHFPNDKRPGVLQRLGTMTEVSTDVLEEIAAALASELPDPRNDAATAVDGVRQSAALVRRLGRENAEALLGTLAEDNEELATEIRRAMYSFEDLRVLDSRSMRSLLEAVPVERLTLALKTASEALRDHIFSSMSRRAADRIREDMDVMGGVRLADVEAAQRDIVEIALKLEAEGTISLESQEDAVV